jgi:restriction endonuclease Mrr
MKNIETSDIVLVVIVIAGSSKAIVTIVNGYYENPVWYVISILWLVLVIGIIFFSVNQRIRYHYKSKLLGKEYEFKSEEDKLYEAKLRAEERELEQKKTLEEKKVHEEMREASLRARQAAQTRELERQEQIKTEKLREILKSKSALFNLNGFEFEDAMIQWFRDKGYKAVKPKVDRGIDIILTDKSGNKIAVQCKHYQKRAGSPMVRNFKGALQLEGFNKGIFIASHGTTKEGERILKIGDIELLTLDDIIKHHRNET